MAVVNSPAVNTGLHVHDAYILVGRHRQKQTSKMVTVQGKAMKERNKVDMIERNNFREGYSKVL